MQTCCDEQARPVTRRATFTLRFAFWLLSFATVAVPAFFLTGGYFVYGPLLVIFLLSVVFIAQFRQARATVTEWTLRNTWKPIAVFVALLLSVIGFAPLASTAYDFYTQEQLRALQLNLIADIPKDEDFLQVALVLHQWMLGPDGQRHLPGTSELVPQELTKLLPISVNASEDCLTLQLSRNNDRVLIIYSPDSKLPRVHGKPIVDNIHYWDRRR